MLESVAQKVFRKRTPDTSCLQRYVMNCSLAATTGQQSNTLFEMGISGVCSSKMDVPLTPNFFLASSARFATTASPLASHSFRLEMAYCRNSSLEIPKTPHSLSFRVSGIYEKMRVRRGWNAQELDRQYQTTYDVKIEEANFTLVPESSRIGIHFAIYVSNI